MDRANRLRLIAKACYYLGWAALVVAIIWHLASLDLMVPNVARISGRNLLETCAVLFIACIASEARALGAGAK